MLGQSGLCADSGRTSSTQRAVLRFASPEADFSDVLELKELPSMGQLRPREGCFGGTKLSAKQTQRLRLEERAETRIETL